MRPSVDDLFWAWSILLREIFCGSSEAKCFVVPGIAPGADHRLDYAKVRAVAVDLMRERRRFGPKRSGHALDLAVCALERQGYIKLSPLGEGPEQVIEFTYEGNLLLLDDEWPEFCEADTRA